MMYDYAFLDRYKDEDGITKDVVRHINAESRKEAEDKFKEEFEYEPIGFVGRFRF